MLIPIMIIVLLLIIVAVLIVHLIIIMVRSIKSRKWDEVTLPLIFILLLVIVVLAGVYNGANGRETSGRLVGSECSGVKGSSDGVAIKVIDSGGNVVE